TLVCRSSDQSHGPEPSSWRAPNRMVRGPMGARVLMPTRGAVSCFGVPPGGLPPQMPMPPNWFWPWAEEIPCPSCDQTGLWLCCPVEKNPCVSTSIRCASPAVRFARYNGSPSPLLKYTSCLSSGDHEGAVAPRSMDVPEWPRNARGVPPVTGIFHFGALASPSPCSVNQTSPLSPEKPR